MGLGTTHPHHSTTNNYTEAKVNDDDGYEHLHPRSSLPRGSGHPLSIRCSKDSYYSLLSQLESAVKLSSSVAAYCGAEDDLLAQVESDCAGVARRFFHPDPQPLHLLNLLSYDEELCLWLVVYYCLSKSGQ